ncbi:TIGR01777 family oxidoreductase [Robertkochia solimangrovi]|uniref:TIGR01777 family oxidoreductase n=1 Tax=Robertkochia solimangrovi TaxID=2213046 RepID=UPI00117BEE86|nr:TIGR01777 family oxidoreductase [Robertkochia solimangrovi]TRZ43723.1 TIGR01777 family protein [Robertkochia solimangrovi]
MRILITGATGLIGSAIVRLCHHRGYQVNYLTTRKNKIVHRDDYHGFYWNPSAGKIDDTCFNGVDAVINLAGTSIASRWTPQNKKKILKSRISSLKLLDQTIGKVNHTIKSFVTASAIGIYPHSYTNYYEESCNDVDDSFPGRLTREWEAAADLMDRHDFNVVKVRTGLVLSEKGGALPKLVKAARYFMSAAAGNGEQWQSWIHIEDIAALYLFVIEEELNGVFNAVAPNPVTNAKMTSEIASIVHRSVVLPNIPQFVLKLLLGEMSYILISSQRVSAKKIQEEGFHFQYERIQPALMDLVQEKGQLREELA